jgi:hypothetical protein
VVSLEGVGTMLEWREHDHELNDNATMDDPPTLETLWNCGLLKCFLCQNMQAQPAMLHTLVNMWDSERQHFIVQDHILTLEMEDMYFLLGLSHRVATVVLVGGKRGGIDRVDDYVVHYCHPRTHKRNNKLTIGQVMDLTLHTILFTITWAVGSMGPHLASRSQVDYAVMSFSPTVYNWCAVILANMKEKLTKCKLGGQKQFVYGSILLSFFFE